MSKYGIEQAKAHQGEITAYDQKVLKQNCGIKEYFEECDTMCNFT